MKLKVAGKIIETPFQYPFTTFKGTKTHQSALVVELEYFGIKGYGESPAIHYYNVTAQDMLQVLQAKQKFIEQFALTDPERFWHFLHHLLPAHPFLVNALDMAAWDIYGKMRQKPLYNLWNLNVSDLPVTDYTIGIDATDVMQQKLKDNPWPVYKIKMGFPNDVETLRSLRNVTDSPFRVDVNEGWTATEAIDKLTMIANMQVELVEQPTEKYNTEQARHIYELSPLPVFADESCVSEKDILGCTGLYHGVNIKLTKCSGITPARRMIQEAKKNGLKVMLGCMNETSLGTAAMLHLAPMVDYLDADGPLLLKESAVQSLSIQNGKYDMPTGNGLGVVVDFDQI